MSSIGMLYGKEIEKMPLIFFESPRLIYHVETEESTEFGMSRKTVARIVSVYLDLKQVALCTLYQTITLVWIVDLHFRQAFLLVASAIIFQCSINPALRMNMLVLLSGW